MFILKILYHIFSSFILLLQKKFRPPKKIHNKKGIVKIAIPQTVDKVSSKIKELTFLI